MIIGCSSKSIWVTRLLFAKMILPWEDHCGKRTVRSLIYFLNYSLLSFLAQSQILVISLYIKHWFNFLSAWWTVGPLYRGAFGQFFTAIAVNPPERKLAKCTSVALHRDAICQFLFQWIYYCHSSKSTGNKIGKTHLCALVWFPAIARKSVRKN